MARIAGVDLPNDKRIEIALTYIYGRSTPAIRAIFFPPFRCNLNYHTTRCREFSLQGTTKELKKN